MSYKRLTNYNLEEYDPEYDFCIDCKYFGEPNGCNRPNGTCDNYDRFIETYNRLAELEDKIENGTLVVVNKPFIALDYISNGKEYYAVKIAEERDLAINLTKAEAEKKLEELSKNP